MSEVGTIGLDLAKTVFQGVDVAAETAMLRAIIGRGSFDA